MRAKRALFQGNYIHSLLLVVELNKLGQPTEAGLEPGSDS